MEVQLSMQQKMLTEMRTELALSKEHKAMAESSAGTRSIQVGHVCVCVCVLSKEHKAMVINFAGTRSTQVGHVCVRVCACCPKSTRQW